MSDLNSQITVQGDKIRDLKVTIRWEVFIRPFSEFCFCPFALLSHKNLSQNWVPLVDKAFPPPPLRTIVLKTSTLIYKKKKFRNFAFFSMYDSSWIHIYIRDPGSVFSWQIHEPYLHDSYPGSIFTWQLSRIRIFMTDPGFVFTWQLSRILIYKTGPGSE